LVEKADPNGTDTCYTYDSIGRLVNIYANGLSACMNTSFYYDGSLGFAASIPTGVSAPTYSYGRMVEAATTNCTGTIALITDEWFSYDKDGNLTDTWELTPNSGTYYHSSGTFAGNGVVTGVTISSPSESVAYGLDGEGRWQSLVNGTTALVSVTNGSATTGYTAAGQPSYIAIGGSSDTDYEYFTYDTNTARMTNWKFQVGSTPASETGALTWNANGSLGSVAISDGFNSGGTQTCNFGISGHPGYDDAGRLIYDDCGSGGWGQSFSYDSSGYNNLTKAVLSGRTGITFNPGYNTSNNQFASGFGGTYDSDGNLTYDTNHHYTYDQHNKVASIDLSGTGCSTSGQCLVYDALGRVVEMDSAGVATEILYTQLGKTLFLNGTTLKYAYWPTPGRSTVLQTSGGNFHFFHKDWLGNARIVSDIAGQSVVADRAFAPFGEIYNTFGTINQNEASFTGDTEDVAVGNSDTPNRQFQRSGEGRWMSPDPAGAGWNLYAYATNPNSFTDPSGLDIRQPCGTWCGAFNDPWNTAGGAGSWGSGSSAEGNPGSQMSAATGYDGQYAYNPYGRYTGLVPGADDGAAYDYQLVLGANGPQWINNLNGMNVAASDALIEMGLVLPMPFGYLPLPVLPSTVIPTSTGRLQKTIGPAPKQPSPKSTRVTASCMTGRLIDNFGGPGGSLTLTTVLNVAAVAVLKPAVASLLPGPGWLYTGVAVVYDLGMVGKSYAECKNGEGEPTPPGEIEEEEE
jgi:RHS repeat-associated protein